jgi:hypothetical protein
MTLDPLRLGPLERPGRSRFWGWLSGASLGWARREPHRFRKLTGSGHAIHSGSRQSGAAFDFAQAPHRRHFVGNYRRIAARGDYTITQPGNYGV